MTKTNKPNYEEVLADLKFMLEQSYIIEHMQDMVQIRKLCKKYGVTW